VSPGGRCTPRVRSRRPRGRSEGVRPLVAAERAAAHSKTSVSPSSERRTKPAAGQGRAPAFLGVIPRADDSPKGEVGLSPPWCVRGAVPSRKPRRAASPSASRLRTPWMVRAHANDPPDEFESRGQLQTRGERWTAAGPNAGRRGDRGSSSISDQVVSFEPSQMPARPPRTPKSSDWNPRADAPHSSGTKPPKNNPATAQIPTTDTRRDDHSSLLTRQAPKPVRAARSRTGSGFSPSTEARREGTCVVQLVRRQTQSLS
jgi:hypothetical protein